MHRLATNYAKNYCNRTPIVKVIVENVVTRFFGHGVAYLGLSFSLLENKIQLIEKSPQTFDQIYISAVFTVSVTNNSIKKGKLFHNEIH